MFKKIILSVILLLFATGYASAQGYGIGTPVEAKNMVMQAIAYLKASGEEKALQEFNKLNGKARLGRLSSLLSGLPLSLR